MKQTGAIFDVDGTLVDNHAAHEEAWMVWCARHGLSIDREFYRERLYGRTNDAIFRILYGEQIPPDTIARLAAEKEAIYREIYAPLMKPTPGLIEFLRALHTEEIPCAVASNAERVNVDFVVDGLGLRPFFRALVSREDVARGKPEPDLFLAAAERIGVPPTHCWAFEDSETGFESARRAGMKIVAIVGARAGKTPPCYVEYAVPDFRHIRVVDLLNASRPPTIPAGIRS